MKKLLLASIAISALVLWAVSCGGGGAGTTPTGPSNTTPPPQTLPSVTVNIVSSAGSGAFSPNPVQVPSGGSIEWKNTTSSVHVLVMSDGTPIGTVAPGATLTKAIGAGGGFRCSNHPSMVGSINGAAAPTPPDDKGDGYGY